MCALKRSRFVLTLLAALPIAAVAPSAQADPQWCSGTMSNLIVYSNGDVMAHMSWRGNYVRLCNVNGTAGQVSVTSCASWLSLARSAVQRGASTMVYYAESPACSAMPTYDAAPVPFYVMLQN